MTTYTAAYDTEAPECLAGLRRIVEVHERHEMPATLFLVARLLDNGQQADYVSLLRDHPLFEIACHSYTHMVLRKTEGFGDAGSTEHFAREIVDSKARIEDAFGVAVKGFRPPVGSDDGLKDVPEALALIDEAGYAYVSSLLWGPQFSLPALLVEPYTYAEQGYPALWELPACGWHENLLKGNNNCGPVRIGLFPPAVPEAMPSDYVKTPAEEFAVNNKVFLDRAVRQGHPHVSFIWHPWSLHRFDPAMEMLALTFSYVKELGLEHKPFSTFRAERPQFDSTR